MSKESIKYGTNGEKNKGHEDGITATGVNAATAYVITKEWNEVSVTPPLTGVKFSATGQGLEYNVVNLGANALKIYSSSGNVLVAAMPGGYFLNARCLNAAGTKWGLISDTIANQ